MRRSIEGDVYQREAFLPNGWLKERLSIEGGVYQREAFIRENMVNIIVTQSKTFMLLPPVALAKTF